MMTDLKTLPHAEWARLVNEKEAYQNLLVEFLVNMVRFKSEPLEFDRWFSEYQMRVVEIMAHWAETNMEANND